MNNQLRVVLEIGPKGKKVVAVASDWPGLVRGAKTADEALARLQAYVPRYAPIAKLAGMDDAFSALTTTAIVEEYQGVSSTDFWGISFAFSSVDHAVMSSAELERELALMRACWVFFDDVGATVSAEMQKGARGGGRDRDQIIRHTLVSEMDMAKKVGMVPVTVASLTPEALNARRDAYCDAIRAFHANGKLARKWPLRYLIRHTAYHSMDHAWEMQDKDLTGAS